MIKCKVLISLFSLTCGGGEKALVNMLNSLPKDKYDITLQLFRNVGCNLQFVPDHVKISQPLFPDGFPTKRERLTLLSKRFYLKGILRMIMFYLKSRKANSRERAYYEWKTVQPFCRANTESYDVAIAAMHGLSTYYVFDMIQAERKVCWIHTDFSKIPQFKDEAKYFESAYRIVTVSEQCYKSFHDVYPTLQNVVMLYNLNCPDLMERMATEFPKAQCYPDTYQYHCLSIGRLVKVKGFDMLIEAAKGLKERGISFAWYILGQGEEEKNLKDMAKALGVDDCVVFAGLAENPYPYIKWADIIVQTSRYEGKSMVLDEAKILNKPIVTTSYDSVYDQIENGETGVLVPISSDGIENGVAGLLADEQLMEHLISTLSEKDKTQTALIKDYEALIEGVL